MFFCFHGGIFRLSVLLGFGTRTTVSYRTLSVVLFLDAVWKDAGSICREQSRAAVSCRIVSLKYKSLQTTVITVSSSCNISSICENPGHCPLKYSTTKGIYSTGSHYIYPRCSFAVLFCLIFYYFYSTLLHLPPLRFHCVWGCWDRTHDLRLRHWLSDALTTRLDLSATLG